jgi:tRNA U34 5-methylaminomethyl-2-thiouridine-forming methyltransferase MnmC
MIRLIETADGSTSLYHEALNETYHSRHGALNESLHVFIRNGLHALGSLDCSVKVLEVGFGTGLNAFLLYRELTHHQALKVHYTGLEPFPLEAEILYNIRFDGIDRDVFKQLHKPVEGSISLADGRFTGNVLAVKLDEFKPAETFDLIFFDAFAPGVQPELWSDAVMHRMASMLSPGGIWVSYCAKGSVRRSLQEAGLLVERLPGPPYKKHMLRARKA